MQPHRGATVAHRIGVHPGEHARLLPAELGRDDRLQVREHPVIEVDGDLLAVGESAHQGLPSAPSATEPIPGRVEWSDRGLGSDRRVTSSDTISPFYASLVGGGSGYCQKGGRSPRMTALSSPSTPWRDPSRRVRLEAW